MTHEELYERAKKAIDDLFSDTSVSQESTRESLQGLRHEIDTALGALEEDA